MTYSTSPGDTASIYGSFDLASHVKKRESSTEVVAVNDKSRMKTGIDESHLASLFSYRNKDIKHNVRRTIDVLATLNADGAFTKMTISDDRT